MANSPKGPEPDLTVRQAAVSLVAIVGLFFMPSMKRRLLAASETFYSFPEPEENTSLPEMAARVLLIGGTAGLMWGPIISAIYWTARKVV